jgi:chromosome partitioning protein
MHVIVLASQKGAAGKITWPPISQSRPPATARPCIDADPQGRYRLGGMFARPRSQPWHQRELPSCPPSLQRFAYAVAVVDTPPAITEAISAVVRSATLVLIPTRPSPHDLRAMGSTVELVEAAEKPFAFAITQAKANARLTVQAMAALSEHGIVAPAIVHDRVDYAGSTASRRRVGRLSTASPVRLPLALGCYQRAPRRTFTSNPVPMSGTEVLKTPTSCDLAQNIQNRFRRAGDQLLTFTHGPAGWMCPNNSRECALRPAVIQRKVTNGYRAVWSAEGKADIRTVVDTARLKRRANSFKTILQIVAV